MKKISDLEVYTCAAMCAAACEADDIQRAADHSLLGKTDHEPTDIHAVIVDILTRGFHVGPDGMVWGIEDWDERDKRKDYVLVRLGRPFSE